MNTQPEALRLADILQHRIPSIKCLEDAAAELRRLHELNQELVEALIACRNDLSLWMQDYGKDDETVDCVFKAYAALDKARGNT